MKKHIFIITVIGYCLTVVGCTLDEDPRDQIPEEEAYTSQEALIRNAIATLYNDIGGSEDGQGLQGTCRGIYDLQTFGSDEAMLPKRGIDWYDGGIWQQLYRHNWTARHPLLKNSWIYLYKAIAHCNHSLKRLEAYKDLLSEEVLSIYVAEVRALRAIYYWQLLDLFGNVPIITSTYASIYDVKQSTRKEVFDFVEEELREACARIIMGNSAHLGVYYGRVTLSVAYFVLAKLLLNAEAYTGTPQWEECIAFCDRIEMLQTYGLENDYSANFAVNNETSCENIWVIPMSPRLHHNQQQNLFRSYHSRHAAAYGFGGENGSCATRRVLEVFGYGTDHQDKRFDMNYWAGPVVGLDMVPVTDRKGSPLVYEPWQVALDLSGSPYVETAGARMKKYAIDRNAMQGGKLMENDIVLFRYADVLLMRAEAKYRLSQTGNTRFGDGQRDYDAVRSRVEMPMRTITLQNLLDERLMELCWEGWRRQDLIRFGQYESLYEGPGKVDESDGHTTLFPIPADIMALNHNLKQNPGY